MAQTRNQAKQRSLFKQKVVGLILMGISAVLVLMAMCGGPNDNDCTAIAITAPLGMLCLLSDKTIIW